MAHPSLTTPTTQEPCKPHNKEKDRHLDEATGVRVRYERGTRDAPTPKQHLRAGLGEILALNPLSDVYMAYIEIHLGRIVARVSVLSPLLVRYPLPQGHPPEYTSLVSSPAPTTGPSQLTTHPCGQETPCVGTPAQASQANRDPLSTLVAGPILSFSVGPHPPATPCQPRCPYYSSHPFCHILFEARDAARSKGDASLVDPQQVGQCCNRSVHASFVMASALDPEGGGQGRVCPFGAYICPPNPGPVVGPFQALHWPPTGPSRAPALACCWFCLLMFALPVALGIACGWSVVGLGHWIQPPAVAGSFRLPA